MTEKYCKFILVSGIVEISHHHTIEDAQHNARHIKHLYEDLPVLQIIEKRTYLRRYDLNGQRM